MENKQIIYTINGAVATAFSRLVTSKTFWVIAILILTAGDRWSRGEISGSDFFQMMQIGVIGILIRAAMSRAELAANAANPQLGDITAITRERRFPTEIIGGISCLVITGALLGLTACSVPGGPLYLPVGPLERDGFGTYSDMRQTSQPKSLPPAYYREFASTSPLFLRRTIQTDSDQLNSQLRRHLETLFFPVEFRVKDPANS